MRFCNCAPGCTCNFSGFPTSNLDWILYDFDWNNNQ
jgi:hypothetical protein